MLRMTGWRCSRRYRDRNSIYSYQQLIAVVRTDAVGGTQDSNKVTRYKSRALAALTIRTQLHFISIHDFFVQTLDYGDLCGRLRKRRPYFPEVIPGPRLPSLASRFDFDFYNRVPTAHDGTNSPDSNPTCYVLTCWLRRNEQYGASLPPHVWGGPPPPSQSPMRWPASTSLMHYRRWPICFLVLVQIQSTHCTCLPYSDEINSACREVATGGNVVINTRQGNGSWTVCVTYTTVSRGLICRIPGANAATGNENLIVTLSEA